jgi:hypothetical protein
MNKFVSIVLAVFMTAGLAACGNYVNTSGDGSDITISQPFNNENTAINDKIQTDQSETTEQAVTVLEGRPFPEGTVLLKSEGYFYAIDSVTGEVIYKINSDIIAEKYQGNLGYLPNVAMFFELVEGYISVSISATNAFAYIDADGVIHDGDPTYVPPKSFDPTKEIVTINADRTLFACSNDEEYKTTVYDANGNIIIEEQYAAARGVQFFPENIDVIALTNPDYSALFHLDGRFIAKVRSFVFMSDHSILVDTYGVDDAKTPSGLIDYDGNLIKELQNDFMGERNYHLSDYYSIYESGINNIKYRDVLPISYADEYGEETVNLMDADGNFLLDEPIPEYSGYGMGDKYIFIRALSGNIDPFYHNYIFDKQGNLIKDNPEGDLYFVNDEILRIPAEDLDIEPDRLYDYDMNLIVEIDSRLIYTTADYMYVQLADSDEMGYIYGTELFLNGDYDRISSQGGVFTVTKDGVVSYYTTKTRAPIDISE